MLPFIYPGKDAKKILEDVQGSDIPQLHKQMFLWIEKFTRHSSSLSRQDSQHLLDHGATESDIVEWANVASTQTWFVMNADGGGIPLEGNAVVGSVIGAERSHYHASTKGTAPRDCSPVVANSELSWVTCDESSLGNIAEWAAQRYQFTPNLFRANSLAPQYFPRLQLALELLEGPQSENLTPRQHAMVRRFINRKNAGHYLDLTTETQLTGHDESMLDVLNNNADFSSLTEVDQVVMRFADKLICNAFKVTEKDAASFRAAGLDDQAYVDVLNTVAIQTSLDRLSNSLGIQPDAAALLSRAG